MLQYDCECGRRPGLKCDGSCDLHPAPKRSSIVERREQIQSLARPQKLSNTDIIGEVAAIRETADLYKVYRSEWIIVFSSLKPGDEGRTEAEEYLNKRYEGRVREADIDYRSSSKTHPEQFPVHLVLRLPNVKGEFKTKQLAEAYVESQSWTDATIVTRNSHEEHVLREYSVKKLPKEQAPK